jgi:signal transduction histidine kinase
MADGMDIDDGATWARGLSALEIAFVYFVFGTGMLFLFDLVAPRVIRSHALLHRIQTIKGGLEVAATTLIVYVLVARSWRSLNRTNEQLQESRIRLAVLYRVLRHNLRTEMTLIRGYAERARNEARNPAAREASGEAVSAADSVSRAMSTLKCRV